MAKAALLVFLGAFLTVAVWWSASVWDAAGEAELSADGSIALWLGVVVSLVLGVGLMTVMFQSSRRGYDATVEFEKPGAPPADRGT